MAILIVLLIAILLFVLLYSKLTFRFVYEDKKFGFSLRFLGIRIDEKTFGKKTEKPVRNKKKSETDSKRKSEEEKKTKKQQAGENKNNGLSSLNTFLNDNLRYITKALRRLNSKVVVKKIRFEYECGFDDAVVTALCYGAASGVFYNLYAYLQRHFTVKSTQVKILPDFNQERYDIAFEGIFTVRMVNIIFAAISLFPMLFNFIKRGVVNV